MNSINLKPDSIGAALGSLCLIHCIATPFLFLAQTCTSTCCDSSPIWWQALDYVFLALSFFAIIKSTQTSNKTVMKYGLWLSWVVLFVAILNEHMEAFIMSNLVRYISGFSLVILHLYNMKYCQCNDDKCLV